MRAILKTFILLSFLYISNIASAQTGKTDFAGIWEFIRFGADSANLGQSAKGVLVIRTDSTFITIRHTNERVPFITQSGEFKIRDDKFFTQKTTYQLPALGTQGVGQEGKMYYWFTPDKKFLRYSYTMDSGEVYYEVWRRL